MTISILIVVAIFILFGPKRILHYLIIGLLAYSFPLHFLLAVLVVGALYYLFNLLLGRFNWIRRFF